MTIQNILANFLDGSACPLVCLFVALAVAGLSYGLVCGYVWLMRKHGKLVAAFLLSVALFSAVVADKPGTNAPPNGVSGTNVVEQTGGDGTNDTGGVAGPLMAGRRMGATLSNLPPNDGPVAESFAVRPANAVENAWWRARGAHVDGMTIPAEGWSFRTPAGFLESLLVYSYGDIQPDVETTYFPRPFPEADISLLPEGRWGMLPHDGEESLFWHATSPSNSLILAWQNAAYNRDANCPTNLQIELFSNGTYVYRYDDRTEHHAVEYPFDLDGDGLANEVDPEPLVAGPDAHGTNAEWYDLVCSGVFSKTEQPNGLPIPLPGGESVFFKPGVNTNAYYFVDVIAERGPAPVYFNSSHPGRLGAPIVVAFGGETNRVPMLIGATYSVSSDVPFTVSCPTNGFAEVSWSDGMNAMVKWPLNFTFVEELSGMCRSYMVEVEPFDPGGTFLWGGGQGGATLQGVLPPSGGGACGCASGNGVTVTFGCSPTCTCGGNCLAVGAFNVEHAIFAVTGGVCRCGFDDPAPAEAPTYEPTAGASLAIAFSGPTVAFEGESGRASDALRVKKSTRVCLTVSAYGGPNGGTATFSRTNFAKLRLVGVNGFELPSSLHLDAGQSFFATCVCEGVEASSAVNDIVVSGRFVEDGAGTLIDASASLTSCRVAFVTPTGDPAIREEETDSGDGQNEFTFDDATQTLTIGLKVRIEPDVTQLSSLGQCVFSLPTIGGSVLSWTGNSGRIGLPMPQSGGVGALVQATARYVGYPLSNSGFGRKTATFNALGLTITTDYEVFFPSDGTHHPACSTCANCPNWFYYWKEGGVCGITSDVFFDVTLPADDDGITYGRFDHLTRRIMLGRHAPELRTQRYATKYRYETVVSPPILETVSILDVEESIVVVPAITNVFRREVGHFKIGAVGAGIRAVAATVKHEKRHKEIFLEQLNSGVTGPTPDIDGLLGSVSPSGIQNENPFGINPRTIEDGIYDRDGDNLLDQSEVSGRWGLKTETNRRDSFNLAQNIADEYLFYGDNEAQARYAENEGLSTSYFPSLDWCNPGCQSKRRRGPLVDETSQAR